MAVKDYYSMIVPCYEELYGEEQLKKFSDISEFLSISVDDFVLDMGCGTGLVTTLLARVAGSVVGIDVAKGMISEARRKTGPLYVVADAAALPFRDKAFNKVIALTVMQNVDNPNVALLEILRVCRQKAVITVPKRWIGLGAITAFLSGLYLTIFEGDKDIYLLVTLHEVTR